MAQLPTASLPPEDPRWAPIDAADRRLRRFRNLCITAACSVVAITFLFAYLVLDGCINGSGHVYPPPWNCTPSGEATIPVVLLGLTAAILVLIAGAWFLNWRITRLYENAPSGSE